VEKRSETPRAIRCRPDLSSVFGGVVQGQKAWNGNPEAGRGRQRQSRGPRKRGGEIGASFEFGEKEKVRIMDAFYTQVQEFCQMMQEELAERWDTLPATPTSSRNAQSFTEKMLLCPTIESARSCIQKDFPGALSFVLAMEGLNRRILEGGIRLPTEWPKYQTRFYMLGCAVQDYIDSLRAETPAESEVLSEKA
jgi:hypothetical protein